MQDLDRHGSSEGVVGGLPDLGHPTGVDMGAEFVAISEAFTADGRPVFTMEIIGKQ